MKQILIIFIGIVIFSSCDETLTIPPNTALIADTAFNDEEDLGFALNGVYAALDRFNYIQFNSTFSDETKIGVDNGGQQFNEHSLILNPSTGVAFALWTNRYTMINRANRVIEAAGLIEVTDQVALDHILGQALALRALAHFELYQFYTPNFNDPSVLSVPAVTEVVTTQNLPRNTAGEVISAVNADITQALQLLDPSQTDINFMTVDAVRALQAKVAFFTGDFATALSVSRPLLESYPITSKEDYIDMFLTDVNKQEVIYQAGVVVGDVRIAGAWVFTNSFGPFLEVADGLIGSIDSQDDIRLETIVDVPRAVGTGVQVVNKYPGVAEPGLNDIKIFRGAEMLLIAAESAARQGDLGTASALITNLRQMRISEEENVIFTSLANAIDFIANERRIELANEGSRFLDLKRLNRSLERNVADCGTLNNACSLTSGDFRFAMPIPIAELSANDLIVQNPGY
jgi:hypothetical protein